MNITSSLKENYAFRRLYARGKSLASPYLVVYYQKNRRGQNRLGLTVGKKVGNAVIRNRTRRRIKEAYRLHEQQIKAGYDIVVVARVKAAFVPYAQLEKSLLKLLDKQGLLQGKNQ